DLLASVARVAVWSFAIVVAVNQIGIATTLVNTLFMGVVGAAAVALGLAFGLGGRETAAEIVRGWYESGRRLTPRLAEAGTAMVPPTIEARHNPSLPRMAEPREDPTRPRMMDIGEGSANEPGESA